ncbi:MAG: hypothetical protein HY347_12675 [candidate division NC10 bacterium]|nr:hypothetical protein [candidate division NC10 bacterium]
MEAQVPRMIIIDETQCRKVAERLKIVKVHELFPEHPTREEKRRRADFWFYVVVICHQTGSLQGEIEGKRLRGWDYLSLAAERAYRMDPNLFTAERIWKLHPEELKQLFSDRLDPKTSTLDRIGERLHLLREAALSLLQWYKGDVWELYERCDGSLSGGTGLLNLLSQFEAYRDPLRKKTSLLLMILWASKIWMLKDLEALRFPVDNHLMRVALRTGMVRVEDEGLQGRLKKSGEIRREEEQSIREAVQQAGDLLLATSGRTVFELDTILWQIGRSCCFSEHPPICGPRATVHPCFKRETCSLIRDTDYPCPDACPLDGTCFGSLDETYALLNEPKVETHYY